MSNSRGNQTDLEKVDPKIYSKTDPKNDPSITTKASSSGSQPDKIQFKTENIGKWSAKQENPFAKQNRERYAKKQASLAKRQKAVPYVIIVSCALIIALATWGLVALLSSIANSQPKLPDELTLGSSGAQEIQDQAQAIFNQHTGQSSNDQNQDIITEPTPEAVQNAITAVNDYFQSQEALAPNDTARNDLILIEIETFYNNDRLEAALAAAQKANPDLMDASQKTRYWGMLANISSLLGDESTANQYMELLMSLNDNEEGEDHD